MNNFMPRPGRFGLIPVPLTSAPITTGTLAAGTQTHIVGAFTRLAYINRAVVVADVFPTASTSVTVQLFKHDASAPGAPVTLSGLIAISASAARIGVPIPITTTLTEAQRTLDVGDSIYLQLVTTGSVSVQPDDLTVVVELNIER
jgi:hypothetical protein